MTLKLLHRGRTPLGVRGLKQTQQRWRPFHQVSHPARGAWIETEYKTALDKVYGGRTPLGVRGLKHIMPTTQNIQGASHPARGAWIETKIAVDIDNAHTVAPRSGCVD